VPKYLRYKNIYKLVIDSFKLHNTKLDITLKIVQIKKYYLLKPMKKKYLIINIEDKSHGFLLSSSFFE